MSHTGLDVETHPIKPGCVAPKLVCTTTDDGTGGKIYNYADGIAEARRILESDHMIGHWVFFDLCVLAAEEPDLLPLIYKALDEGRIHCTKIRQMIIDNAEGRLKFEWNEETNEFKKQSYTLERLIWRHLDKDVSDKKTGDKIWRLRFNELDGVPLSLWPQDATEYAIGDAVDARVIYNIQEDYCAPHGLPAAPQGETWQTQAAWGLYLMGAWGVRTDPEAVAKLKAEVTKEFRAVVETAQRFKLVRKGKKESKNMAAIRAAVEKWYTAHEKPMKWTDGGKKGILQIATDREQLTDVECPCGEGAFREHKGLEGTDDECFVDGIHRGLWAVAEVTRLSKLLSTYIKALERGTAYPLCSSYNPIIETFRTSCSQGMKIDKVPLGTNLQNPPRKHGVRECFIPRPGWMFMFCDYDTLEMLTLAQVCLELFGYSKIAEAAWAGEDFHLSFAADMMGISYAEAQQRMADGDPHMIEMRQGAKIANYGMAGGMGWRTFIQYAKGFGQIIKPAFARQLHVAFRTKWVEMTDYFRFVSNLIGDGNRVKCVTFPKSKLMRGRVTYTATCNGFFQHRAAMGAKAAVYAVSKECYVKPKSKLFGCRPWLFSHDEIGAENPYTGKRASDAALRLQTVMVDEMKSWCPDVPIAATVAMSRRWRKGTAPVFVGDVLVPSKPEGKRWVADVD
jgi:hypothetical protein